MEQLFRSNTHEKNILSHSLFYSFSLYFQKFFNLLGGLLIAKFLGPAAYGLRNAFSVALEYESYTNLGTFAAMNRMAPYYRSGEEKEKTEQIEETVFSVNFLYAAISCIILVLVSLYLKVSKWDEQYVDFTFFFGLIIISNKIKEFYWTKLKLDKEFYLLSKVEMIYGLTLTIISVILTYYWGLRGVFAGILLSNLIVIGYTVKKIGYIPRMYISWSLFGEMIKIGFPMMGVFLLLTVLRSADRILILAMLSEEALGFFGIAIVATSVIAIIPQAIHSVTLPPLMEKLGRTQDRYQIKNYLTEPTVLIAYFLPFLLAILYLAIHLPIEYFLTQYLPAIPVVKILTLGLFFSAAPTLPLSVSFALNKQIQVIYLTLPSVALNFLLNYVFISSGLGINGVAFGTGISYFVFSSIMIWYTFTQFTVPCEEYLKFFLLIYAPFFYTLILLVGMDRFFSLTPSDLLSDLVMTGVKIGFFFVLYFPIFILIRKHSAVSKLTEILAVEHFIRKILKNRGLTKH